MNKIVKLMVNNHREKTIHLLKIIWIFWKKRIKTMEMYTNIHTIHNPNTISWKNEQNLQEEIKQTKKDHFCMVSKLP